MNAAQRLRVTLTAVLAAGALLLGTPAVALAQHHPGEEIATAAKHAGLAASVTATRQVHLHLHHVINCLVGTGDPLFDAAAGYPCKGQGDGALNDVNDAPQRYARLEEALHLARVGTRVQAFRPDHNIAVAVKDLLDEAQPSAGS
ncbi:MAG: hypothetical protein P8076_15045 [Gammaproteobacteria bacterium]